MKGRNAAQEARQELKGELSKVKGGPGLSVGCPFSKLFLDGENMGK